MLCRLPFVPCRFNLVVLPRCNFFLLLDDQTAVYKSSIFRLAFFAGVRVMLEAAIAIGALIVLAFVLWLRPWVDEYSEPYD